MPDKQKCPECKEGAPEYMLTYGDMMTLLLCFFVLLLSMSTIDAKKFEIAATSFQNALNGVLEELPTVAVHKEILQPKLGGDEQNKRIAMEAALEIKEAVKREELDEAVKVEVTESGIAIKILDPIGFDVGKAEIRPELAFLLDKLIEVVNKTPGREIRVEGHTDNTPIRTRRFPSNWELSAARALTVVKFLYNQGKMDPAKLSAVGYGEYRPVAPNDKEVNRSKNRRIEIFVEYLEKRNDG